MAVYNPYAAQPSKDYVEFPPGTNPAIINDYYRAVLASRAPGPDALTDSINALSGVGTQYFGDWIKDSFAQGVEQRKLQNLLTELDYRNMLSNEEEMQKRRWAAEDQDLIGRATGAWADVNAVGPDTTNVYDVPGYTLPPEDVNLPAEPGGYVQLPGETVGPETITETIPGERPQPIDAWARFAGQNPVFAGLLQQKMGATFGQSVLDPSFQENRSSLIRERNVRSDKTAATTDPEVQRLLSTADRNRASVGTANARTNEIQFRSDLRSKAMRLIEAGRPKEAEALLRTMRGEESALDKEGAKYDARTSRGLSADKPFRPSTAGVKGPGQTERFIKRYVELEVKGESRTMEENVEYNVLKKRLMSTGQLEQILNMLSEGQRGGGQRPSLAPGNPNFK